MANKEDVISENFGYGENESVHSIAYGNNSRGGLNNGIKVRVQGHRDKYNVLRGIVILVICALCFFAT